MKAPPEDRRGFSRINQLQTVRIRPAEPQFAEEIRTTLNASHDGFYFATSLGHYFTGMVVHVTRDYRSGHPANREEEGTIMRVDKLKKGRWGVAVHFAREIPAKKIG